MYLIQLFTKRRKPVDVSEWRDVYLDRKIRKSAKVYKKEMSKLKKINKRKW